MILNRLTALLGVILFIGLNSLNGQSRPNILFIAIDDLNDYVNCLKGSVSVPTPNIDRLASKGTLFTNAHSQAPLCGPSRACIMTGIYPSNSGNYLMMKDEDIMKGSPHMANAVFMPDYFEKHGYKTMAVGKIYHEGDAARTFDEYGGKLSWYGPKPNEQMKYDPSKMPEKTGNTQTDWGPYPEHDSIMMDYQYAHWTIEKLQEKHEKPFFLAVGFIRPHVPWHVPQQWFDMFPLDAIQLPPYKPDDFDDIPAFAALVADAPMMPTTEEMIASGQWKEVVQAYMACVAFVDAQVGRVLDALESSDYADNTIVVLWSDHGYHLGEKNRFAKQALWERDTRVPLIFSLPGEKEAAICKAPVQLVDIYPTLIDLCRLPKLDMLDGHSLTPLIARPGKAWKHKALSFYGEGNVAVRSDRFRLMQYEDGSKELYDMLQDPNEWTNLANEKEYKKMVMKLMKCVPRKWAPLSKHSRYEFNKYFIEKSNRE